jgi:F0F1-type ATP synthase assembly protein I
MVDDQRERRQMGRYLSLGQVGFEMVVPIIGGILLDRWLGTVPWLFVAGVVLGFVGGLIHLIRLVNKLNSEDSPKTPKDST